MSSTEQKSALTVRVQQEARGEWSVYISVVYLAGPFKRREDAQKWADDYRDEANGVQL